MEKLTVVGNDRKKMKYIVDDILDKAGIDCDWESDTEFAVKTEDVSLVKDILDTNKIEVI